MKERVLTAIVLLAIVVGALFFDPTGWAVKVLVVAVAFASQYELGRIAKLKHISMVLPVVLALAVFTGNLSQGVLPTFVSITGALISAALLVFGIRKGNEGAKYMGGTFWVFCTVYPLYHLAATKSPAHWPLLMTAAIPIWCGDTAAIFVGKAFGKHKMAPEISPKKTWEGAAGNFLACVIAALVLGAIFHYPILPMVLLGLNCGILGQAGDLFESWLKRKADMKDSGNILPGHGGVLDRIDSLMATAPISLLILQLMVPEVVK